MVNLTDRERKFIKETLLALNNGAVIGKKHYTIVFYRTEYNNLLKKL